MSPYEKLGIILYIFFVAYQNGLKVSATVNDLLMKSDFNPYTKKGNFQEIQFLSTSEPQSWSEKDPVEVERTWSSETPHGQTWSTGDPPKTFKFRSTGGSSRSFIPRGDPNKTIKFQSTGVSSGSFIPKGDPKKVKIRSTADSLKNVELNPKNIGKHVVKPRSPIVNTKKISVTKYSSDDSDPDNDSYQKWSSFSTNDDSSNYIPSWDSNKWFNDDDSSDPFDDSNIDRHLQLLKNINPGRSVKSSPKKQPKDLSIPDFETFAKFLSKNNRKPFPTGDSDNSFMGLHRSEDNADPLQSNSWDNVNLWDPEFLASFENWAKRQKLIKPTMSKSASSRYPNGDFQKVSISKYSSTDDDPDDDDDIWPSEKRDLFRFHPHESDHFPVPHPVRNYHMNSKYPGDNMHEYYDHRNRVRRINNRNTYPRRRRPIVKSIGYTPNTPKYPDLIKRIGMMFGR